MPQKRKEWEKMEKEHGTRLWGWFDDKQNSIKMNHRVTWTESNEKEFTKMHPDRIVTITREEVKILIENIISLFL